MIQINLVPDVKQELLRAQVQRNIVTSAAILLSIAAGAVVVLVALYVFGAQNLAMSRANSTIDTEYETLSKVEDLDRLLTVQNQLKKVSELNNNKNVTSRLYGMLNVIVPTDPHEVVISSLTIEPVTNGDDESSGSSDDLADESTGASPEESTDDTSGQGAVITIEGQTVGGYASLEVFEKTIASTVIEYTLPEEADKTGTLDCGNSSKQCRYLAEGDGDRSLAITVSEMSFGEDENGGRTLRFKLSFTVVPEFLSNVAENVNLKIGINGNVTDSFLNAPRAIFRDRSDDEGGQ